MAKSEKKIPSRIKDKKKTWYKLIAPKEFGNKVLGESYLETADVGQSRTFIINLKDITGNIRDQNAYVHFLVDKVEGSQLHTKAIGYELTAAFVKRLVRKNSDRLDTFSTLKTADGKQFVLKGLLLTTNKTHQTIRAALRKEYDLFFQEEASKSDTETFISNVVSYKLQSTLKRKLSKIYPLREVSVRMLKVMSQATDASQPVQQKVVQPA